MTEVPSQKDPGAPSATSAKPASGGTSTPAETKKRKSRAVAESRPQAPAPHSTGHSLPIQLPFLEKIKQRHVGRVAILYLVVGYLVLEVFGVFVHLLALPEWVGRGVVIVVALGFPVALLFAWAYEITPEGIKPSDQVEPKLSNSKQTGKRLDFAIMALMAVALTYFIVDKFWLSKRITQVAVASTAPVKGAPATFAPPPHSIAVLPFVNMSGDKEQEYFSEGLTEEVLNSLARLNELQVAARTSSFSFQGEHPDIATVAHKLNVGAVLEGSVRRAGHTVRITTQLVNGITGFHLWSQTYDRDLGDVLKLQTEIADAVASALKVTLLGDVAAKIELGGTRNPEAFDAYLRATKAYYERQDVKELHGAVALYTESIRLDPNYALAYADRSLALATFARNWAKGTAVRASRDKAQADANKAIVLAPELAEAHLALASVFEDSLEFTSASPEYERARALAPGNARVLGDYGQFAVAMGHTESGLLAAHRAVELDPLNPNVHTALGRSLLIARRYEESILAMKNAKVLAPNDGHVNALLGLAYYYSGNLQSARAACEESTDELNKGFCLAMVYEKLGRHADAESVFANLRGRWGEDFSVFYGMIYAVWGDNARALDCLETAMGHRDAYLVAVKTAPLGSLRKEPRFQAIEKALKFPD